MVFQKSLHPCPFEEISLSIGRVKFSHMLSKDYITDLVPVPVRKTIGILPVLIF